MNASFRIPRAAKEKLAHPAPLGQRHRQIVEISLLLIGDGLEAEAVFAELRPHYAGDIPDSEIRDVIRWAEKRIPVSTRNGVATAFNGPFAGDKRAINTPFPGAKWAFPGAFRRFDSVSEAFKHPFPGYKRGVSVEAELERPEIRIRRFLSGFTCTEADLVEASRICLPEHFESDAEVLVSALYAENERINVVTQFRRLGKKAVPSGYGKTAPKSEWLAHFRKNGPPISDSGVWIRPNPANGHGISDTDVTVFRFVLLEFDSIPLEIQLPFISRLPISISAIISSGGKSFHAWVFLGAKNAEGYRQAVSRLFSLIAPFGADTANRNPARLSRLPGVYRQIGGTGDNRQRLIYLNPFSIPEPIFK